MPHFVPALTFYKYIQPHYKLIEFINQEDGTLCIRVRWKPFDLFQSVTFAPAELQAVNGAKDAPFWQALCGKLYTIVHDQYHGGTADRFSILNALKECQDALKNHQ